MTMFSTSLIGYVGLGWLLIVALLLLALLAGVILLALFIALMLIWLISMFVGRTVSLKELFLFVTCCGLLMAVVSFGYWNLF